MRIRLLIIFWLFISVCIVGLGIQHHTGRHRKLVSSSRSDTSHVIMTLKVILSIASQDTPATITAEVINRTTSTYNHYAGCDFWGGGMKIEFFGPDSSPVYILNPVTQPKCPDFIASLKPGQKLTGTIAFDGTLYDEKGNQMQARQGKYTAIVTFRYWSGSLEKQGITLQRKVSFTWKER